MNNKTNTKLEENNLLDSIREDVNQQFDELLSSSERFTNEMDSFRIKIESLHEILGSFVEELPSKEIFDGMNELITHVTGIVFAECNFSCKSFSHRM